MKHFYIEDYDGPEEAIKSPRQHESDDFQELAQNAAEHFWHHCDGWEAKWPKTFVILEDGQELGRVKIDVEFPPSFFPS